MTLTTAQGTLRAPRVVIATNAWQLPCGLRNKLFVISSDMIATAPIADRLDEIGWNQGEAITDSQTLVCYYRTTAEGRIAFGKGGGSIGFDGRIRRAMHHNVTRTSTVTRLPSLLPDAAHGDDHPRLGRSDRPNQEQPPDLRPAVRGRQHLLRRRMVRQRRRSQRRRQDPGLSRSVTTTNGHSADLSPARPDRFHPSRSASQERTSSRKRSFAKRMPRRSRSGHHGSLSHSQSSPRPALKTTRRTQRRGRPSVQPRVATTGRWGVR